MQWVGRLFAPRVAPLVGALLLGLWMSPVADAAGFAFGVNAEDFSLSRYRVDSEGRLRHLGHRPIDKAPSSVVIDPSGRFVVAVSSTTDRLMVFRLDAATGGLQPVPGSPFASGTRSPFSLRFHPSGRFAYVGSRFSGVGAYSFDPASGALSPLADSPFPAQRRTRELTIHPSGKFLYAVNGYSNSVSAYQIDERTGGLRELSGSPYSVGDFADIDYLGKGMLDVPPEAGGLPHAIDMDPQGRYIITPNKAAGSVSVFRIDETSGEPSLVEGSPFFVGFNPYRARFHPSGRFVLTTLWADGAVAVQAVDRASGQLTPVPGSPFPTQLQTPVDLAFNADGSQVYVSNYDDNEISLFELDGDSGALRHREGLKTRLSPWALVLAPPTAMPAPPPPTLMAAGEAMMLARLEGAELAPGEAIAGRADALAIAPAGRFAYALNSAENSLITLVVDAQSGALSAVPDGRVRTGSGATDLAIDVNGWYLYVTHSSDATMSVYFLDPQTGIPEAVQGSPILTGRRPVAVSLDPAARFAFVANADADSVSVYRYLNNAAPLIFEGRKYGSPFASGGREPLALTVEPTGHYVYVANAGSHDISVFRIHSKTGALAAIPGSPFKTGQRPVALQVHPEGRWLYVALQDDSSLSIHGIEAGLGALAEAQRTVALPLAPVALWFDEAEGSLLVLGKDRQRLLSYAVDPQSGGLRLRSDRQLAQPVNDFAWLKAK